VLAFKGLIAAFNLLIFNLRDIHGGRMQKGLCYTTGHQ